MVNFGFTLLNASLPDWALHICWALHTSCRLSGSHDFEETTCQLRWQTALSLPNGKRQSQPRLRMRPIDAWKAAIERDPTEATLSDLKALTADQRGALVEWIISEKIASGSPRDYSEVLVALKENSLARVEQLVELLVSRQLAVARAALRLLMALAPSIDHPPRNLAPELIGIACMPQSGAPLDLVIGAGDVLKALPLSALLSHFYELGSMITAARYESDRGVRQVQFRAADPAIDILRRMRALPYEQLGWSDDQRGWLDHWFQVAFDNGVHQAATALLEAAEDDATRDKLMRRPALGTMLKEIPPLMEGDGPDAYDLELLRAVGGRAVKLFGNTLREPLQPTPNSGGNSNRRARIFRLLTSHRELAAAHVDEILAELRRPLHAPGDIDRHLRGEDSSSTVEACHAAIGMCREPETILPRIIEMAEGEAGLQAVAAFVLAEAFLAYEGMRGDLEPHLDRILNDGDHRARDIASRILQRHS